MRMGASAKVSIVVQAVRVLNAVPFQVCPEHMQTLYLLHYRSVYNGAVREDAHLYYALLLLHSLVHYADGCQLNCRACCPCPECGAIPGMP